MSRLARLHAAVLLAACYAVAAAVAFASDDVQEIAVEAVCLLVLAAFCRARRDPRLVWVVLVPLPAFVLLHERIGVKHWVTYLPAAISLAIAATYEAGSTRPSRWTRTRAAASSPPSGRTRDRPRTDRGR